MRFNAIKFGENSTLEVAFVEVSQSSNMMDEVSAGDQVNDGVSKCGNMRHLAPRQQAKEIALHTQSLPEFVALVAQQRKGQALCFGK